MKTPNLGRARRLLRSRGVIVTELAGLGLVAAVGAIVPQAGTASPAEVQAFHRTGEAVISLVAALGFDHVFRGPVFLGLALATAISLAIITIEQIGRLQTSWSQKLTEAHFRSAPLRGEFERPARASGSPGERLAETWTERKIGLAGAAVLHTGLFLLIVAGACRAYFGVDAAVDVMEGETLLRGAQSWVAQWPGVWGKPFGLEVPVRLERVEAVRYAGGGLREYRARLSLLPPGAEPKEAEVTVNHDLSTAGGRVCLGSEFGAGALVQWQVAGAAPVRQAALLSSKGEGRYEAAVAGPDGMSAFLRAEVDGNGKRPHSLEVRVMKGAALLTVGNMEVGSMLALPGGGKFFLHETPFWARLRGSRDPALWLAYAGIALAIAGVALIFMVVKVDYCVKVTSLGQRELVFVAVKPQRFAPLFEDRFNRLVREHGGLPVGMEKVPATASATGAQALPEAPVAVAPRRMRTLGAWTFQAAATPKSLPDPEQNVLESTRGNCAAGNDSRSGSPVGEAFPLPSRLAGGISAFICLVLLTGCQRPLQDQARQLVERYNQVVAEAYRRGDVKLVDPVVGDSEGKKLTGLIGVRLELGLTLDSELLELQVLRAEKSREEFRVWTRERWRYRDRKIGSGAQVGEESLDEYEMCYLFKRKGQSWLAEELRFNRPPKVGRRQLTWLAERRPDQSVGQAPSTQGGDRR